MLRYSFIACDTVCLPLKYTLPYCGFPLWPIFSYILRVKCTIFCKEALSSQTFFFFFPSGLYFVTVSHLRLLVIIYNRQTVQTQIWTVSFSHGHLLRALLTISKAVPCRGWYIHYRHRDLQAGLAGTAILTTTNHKRDSPLPVVLTQISIELKRNVSFNVGIMTQTQNPYRLLRMGCILRRCKSE